MKLIKNLYDNLDKAKAFQISFSNMIYSYGDLYHLDFEECLCEHCGKSVQAKDYLYPKASCKKPYGILDVLKFGVSEELKNELIEHFDVTEADFRPIRTKKGEIVFYQITPQHTMLPICEDNEWIAKSPCPDCGSVKYEWDCKWNEKDAPYHYISQEALDEMHDFNATYERFGFYIPHYVISRRVFDFLIEKYPRAQYIPYFLKSDMVNEEK